MADESSLPSVVDGLTPLADDDQSSLASMVDGLTQVQRTILLCALKNPDYQPFREFSGYVSQHSPYGKEDVENTMLGMAQNHPGSNNINLIYPLGLNGKYVYTKCSSMTEHLFNELDEPLREYLDKDEFKSIEHDHTKWFMPIIPMVLVNGIQAGIGANYNPHHIIDNIKRLLNGWKLERMVPWFREFKGRIQKQTKTSYTTFGVAKERPDEPNTLFITQLPIGKSLEEYEEFLAAALDKDKQPFIQNYTRYHDGNGESFRVVMSSDQMKNARDTGFSKFNLTTNLSTHNVHLLDKSGVRKMYDNPEHILKEFFDLRLEYYAKRKAAMLDDIGKTLLQLKNKCKFIGEVLEKTIDLGKKPEELYADLKVKGYHAFPKEAVLEASIEDYSYLLSIECSDRNPDYVYKMRYERETKKAVRDALIGISPEDLWLMDLGPLEVLLYTQDRRDKNQIGWIWRLASDSEIEKEERTVNFFGGSKFRPNKAKKDEPNREREEPPEFD